MAAIGRVLLMPKGDYSGSAIYNSLDWVRDNGAAWVCKVDGTQGIAPPTLPTTSNANWQLLSADGTVTGSVAWGNVNNKPFDDILPNGGLAVDANKKLKLDPAMLTGSNISYDNTASGLSATTVQLAIDELAASHGGGSTYTASKGVKITNGDIRADLVSDTASSLASVTRTSTANREYPVELDSNSKLAVNVPWVSPGDATITLKKNNSTSLGNFTTNASTDKTIDLPMSDWVAQGSPLNGSVSFTFDDTKYTGTHGFDVYFDVHQNGTTNKHPYAKLNTIGNEGTSSMVLIYDTDADDGINTAYLRVIR